MATALLIWLSSIEPMSHVLLLSLEGNLNLKVPKEADVLVVLGGGLKEYARDLSGLGALSEDSLERVVMAARCYRQLKLPIIVSGGSLSNNRVPEAPVMKRFLSELGVPEDMVMLETKSRDTFENIAFLKDILKEKGFSSPIIITSAYHMKRVMTICEVLGQKASFLPCNFKTWPNRKFYWEEWLPRGSSLRDLGMVMKEYLGIAFYRLKVRT
jgi:uncharacterized SAM-binding protein YcdF (DUF218 family)